MVGIPLFPFGARPIFKCCFAVSFRECKFQIFSIGSLDIAIGSVWFQFVQCFLLRTLQRCHMKIFVDTDDDVRLARRIRRDTVERALGQRIDTDLTWGKSTSCLEKLQVNVFHLFSVESVFFVFCFWQRYQPRLMWNMSAISWNLGVFLGRSSVIEICLWLPPRWSWCRSCHPTIHTLREAFLWEIHLAQPEQRGPLMGWLISCAFQSGVVSDFGTNESEGHIDRGMISCKVFV